MFAKGIDVTEEPRIVTREPQAYLAVSERAAPDQLDSVIGRGVGELFGWLAAHGSPPGAGAPWVRYVEVDMADGLLIEVAVPFDGAVPDGDARVQAGVLPSGHYVTLLYRGHYSGLMAANASLQEWGNERGVTWAMDGPSARRARIEQYLTDPRDEPDPELWETEIAYMVEN